MHGYIPRPPSRWTPALSETVALPAAGCWECMWNHQLEGPAGHTVAVASDKGHKRMAAFVSSCRPHSLVMDGGLWRILRLRDEKDTHISLVCPVIMRMVRAPPPKHCRIGKVFSSSRPHAYHSDACAFSWGAYVNLHRSSEQIDTRIACHACTQCARMQVDVMLHCACCPFSGVHQANSTSASRH